MTGVSGRCQANTDSSKPSVTTGDRKGLYTLNLQQSRSVTSGFSVWMVIVVLILNNVSVDKNLSR